MSFKKQKGMNRMPPQKFLNDEQNSVCWTGRGEANRSRFQTSAFQVFIFEETLENLQFRLSNYKTSASGDLVSNNMHSVISFYDTGAGPSVVREDFLDVE